MPNHHRKFKPWIVGSGLLLACLGLSSAGLAQSSGRIPERVATDSLPPTMEDYAAFLQARGEKDPASEAHATKMVKSLKTLLGRNNLNNATRLKLLRRLADAYRQRADIQWAKSLSEYRDAYHSWQLTSVGDPPKFNEKAAQPDQLRAVSTYRQLLSDYGKGDRLLQQRLDLAVLLGRLGDDNAELYFKELIAPGIPKNASQPAKLGLAELMIGKGDLVNAAPLLVDVAAKGDADLKDWARFRLAWIAGAKADGSGAPKAAELWMALAKRAEKSDRDDAPFSVTTAARKELVALWASLNQDQPAKAFFTQIHDAADYANTLERIGFRNALAKKVPEAITAYEKLRQAFPTRPLSCVIDNKLAWLYDNQKNYAKVGSAMTAMMASCQAGGKQDVGQTRTLLAKTLLTFGTNYYQTTGVTDVNRLKASEIAFHGYLLAFPKGDRAYDVRFARADVLERLGDKEQAAHEYFAVAKVEAGANSLRDRAGEKMLTLQTEVAKAAPAAPNAAPGGLPKPVTLPPAKSFLVDVIDAYAKYFPESAKTVPQMLVAAKLEFDYGHYQEAIPRFDAVVKVAPRGPEGDSATHIVLSYYQTLKDWDQLVAWSETFLKRDLGQSLTGYVTASLRTGMWERANALGNKGSDEPATKAYLAFQARFPTDPQADLALSRALAFQQKDGKGPAGLHTAILLSMTYPTSQYRQGALQASGQINEQMGVFEQAAQAFQVLATDYPRDPGAAASLKRAGELYAAADNKSAAAATLELLARTYRDSPLATDGVLTAAKLYDEQSDYAQSINAYTEYARRISSIDADKALYAQTRAAIVGSGQSGPEAQAASSQLPSIETKLLSMPDNRAIQARNELAKFRLDSATAGLDQFAEVDLATDNLVDFKASCDQLVSQVTTREAALTNVAKLKSPIQTGATEFARGQLYDVAVAKLRGAKFAGGLDPTDAYSMGKIKERLLLTYQHGMVAGYKAAAASSTAPIGVKREALNKLGRLDPSHFAATSERLLTPTFVDHKVHLDQDD